MQIKKFTFNGFQENTYVLNDSKGNCVIVDPGCYDRFEENELLEYIQSNNFNVLALLNTHAHIDHVLGNQFITSQFSVPYYLHSDDLSVLQSVTNYAHLYGFDGYKVSPTPTNFLKGGEILTFGEMVFKVIHAPGHAPGHVVFYSEKDKVVINGDVLFRGSFGRVDLPGGSMEILKKTIFEIMFQLPEETVVYCGHGDETTISEEIRTNYIHQF
jgi:hydroxyacylglutathione hydrolase